MDYIHDGFYFYKSTGASSIRVSNQWSVLHIRFAEAYYYYTAQKEEGKESPRNPLAVSCLPNLTTSMMDDKEYMSMS